MRFITLLVGLVLTSSAFAGSINLGTAGDYNAFIKNNFDSSGPDAQGRVAIGGDLNINGGYDVGYKINDFGMGKGPSLIVGGDVNKSGSGYLNVYEDGKHLSPHSGELVHAGDINITGGNIEANFTQVSATSLPVNFDDEFAYLHDLSADLAQKVASGTTEAKWSALYFNANTTPSDNVYVFNVTQQQMNNVGVWYVDGVNDDATIMFNITNKDKVSSQQWTGGSDICAQGQAGCINMKQSTLVINGKNVNSHLNEHNLDNRLNSQVLYNFSDATELSLLTNLFGTVLAPSADIKAGSSVIWGSVIGQSWQGNMQINHDPFTSTKPPGGPVAQVPEPSTVMIMLLALAGIVVRSMRVSA